MPETNAPASAAVQPVTDAAQFSSEKLIRHPAMASVTASHQENHHEEHDSSSADARLARRVAASLQAMGISKRAE